MPFKTLKELTPKGRHTIIWGLSAFTAFPLMLASVPLGVMLYLACGFMELYGFWVYKWK